MAKTIDYYLALSSPWTYLAGPRFDALVAKHGATVNWKPYDIMRIFSITGTKPVGQRPPQIQKNRLNELGRWRDHLGMALNLHPAHFPVDHTAAGRMVIAASQTGADVASLANAYLTAVWAEERNIGDNDELVAIANQQGLDGAQLLTRSDDVAVEAEFEKNTEDAIAADVFGSPTWVVDGELFWGQDRLEFLDRALAA